MGFRVLMEQIALGFFGLDVGFRLSVGNYIFGGLFLLDEFGGFVG